MAVQSGRELCDWHRPASRWRLHRTLRTTPMDVPTLDFLRACSLAELQAKGRLVVHGRHSPILVVYDGGRVFALDNRCPHMGFPLERGSVEDGILTCHWHHAR